MRCALIGFEPADFRSKSLNLIRLTTTGYRVLPSLYFYRLNCLPAVASSNREGLCGAPNEIHQPTVRLYSTEKPGVPAVYYQ